REERPLGLAVGHAHDELVEQARSAAHQVFMPARQRIEGARIDGSYHCDSTRYRQRVPNRCTRSAPCTKMNPALCLKFKLVFCVATNESRPYRRGRRGPPP